MKTVKIVSLKIGEEESFLKLVKIRLDLVPEKGFTPNAMRKRMKVLDKFEGSDIGDVVDLEDEEYKTLKQCVNGDKWGLLNKEVIRFIDHINATQEKGEDVQK